MNVEFLLCAYFISLFVDWVFQDQWQAKNKSDWSKGNKGYAFMALLSHSLMYAGLTLAGLCFCVYFGVTVNKELPVSIIVLVLFVSHFIIDSRIPVKAIMRFKGITAEQMKDPRMDFMHIGIDHRLHEMVLLVLAFIV